MMVPMWIGTVAGLVDPPPFSSRAHSRSRKPLRLAYDSLRLASRGFYGDGVSYGGLRRLGERSASLFMIS